MRTKDSMAIINKKKKGRYANNNADSRELFAILYTGKKPNIGISIGNIIISILLIILNILIFNDD